MTTTQPPSFYLTKLKAYVNNVKKLGSSRKRRMKKHPVTPILDQLESALKLNSEEWVKEFLNEDNDGLNVLVNYFAFRTAQLSVERASNSDGSIKSVMPEESEIKRLRNCISSDVPSRFVKEDTDDDIYFCLMCLRFLMENDTDFNEIIRERRIVNSLAFSLIHENLRVKSLALEIMSHICYYVSGGHASVLSSFDNLKEKLGEQRRFQSLMETINCNVSNFDFMEVCMHFINHIVHTVPNLNYRVYLQHEFSILGIDKILILLQSSECDFLLAQVQAYNNNMLNVRNLYDAFKEKDLLVQRIEELEGHLKKHKKVIQLTDSENPVKLENS